MFTSKDDDAVVKIVDFGLSKFASRGREQLTEQVGTVKVREGALSLKGAGLEG